MRWLGPALGLVLAPGCQGKPADPQPAPSASASVSPGATSAVSSATTPAPSTSTEQPRAVQGPAVETAKVAKLVFDKGTFVGELERTPPARVWITIATKEQPLAPRAVAAHARIAERVAPGIVAPTALRAFLVRELALAADAATKKRLEKHARVLGDGTVEAAVTLAPAPTLSRLSVAELGEGKPAEPWERRLVARDPVPEAERAALAQYQGLLVIDYVAGNEARVSVFRHDKSGRITAAEGNEAFSPTPKDGAQHDTLARLSRHMTFSRSLDERLGKLERAELESALRWGEPPTLLVTPKQVEECVDRARTVRRLIAERVKQRGAEKALGLP